MININFITKQYQLKIFIGKILKVGILVTAIFLAVEFGVAQFFQTKINQEQMQINNLNAEIAKFQADTKKVQEERKTIPDLTSKIQIIKDIFSQQELRFSSILFDLKEKVNNKLWISDFSYNNNVLSIKGYAAADRKNGLSSELNVFSFEKKLKEIEIFDTVTAEYIRDAEVRENKVKEFKYRISIKSKANESPAKGDE